MIGRSIGYKVLATPKVLKYLRSSLFLFFFLFISNLCGLLLFSQESIRAIDTLYSEIHKVQIYRHIQCLISSNKTVICIKRIALQEQNTSFKESKNCTNQKGDVYSEKKRIKKNASFDMEYTDWVIMAEFTRQEQQIGPRRPAPQMDSEWLQRLERQLDAGPWPATIGEHDGQVARYREEQQSSNSRGKALEYLKYQQWWSQKYR